MHLPAHEVVGRERVEHGDDDRDLWPDRKPPQDEVGHDGGDREGQDEEDVHHGRRVVREEPGEPEEEDVQLSPLSTG